MKKILMAIVLCLVCTVSFGQEKCDEWDELYEYSNIITYHYYEEDSIRFRNEIYDVTTDYVFIQKYKDIGYFEEDGYYTQLHSVTLNEIKIPKVIYDEYKMGTSLFKCGKVFVGVGIPLVFSGMLLQVHGIKRMNEDAIIASSVFYGIGGTCVSVSIPLLCWGDHLKRTSNKDYKLYNLLKK